MKGRNNRRPPRKLPPLEVIPSCSFDELPANGQWRCIFKIQDRNRAYRIVEWCEGEQMEATQRKGPDAYHIYARKLQEAA